MTSLKTNNLLAIMTALICATIVEAIALTNGYNGTMLTVYFGVLTATIGYSFGRIRRPKNGEKET